MTVQFSLTVSISVSISSYHVYFCTDIQILLCSQKYAQIYAYTQMVRNFGSLMERLWSLMNKHISESYLELPMRTQYIIRKCLPACLDSEEATFTRANQYLGSLKALSTTNTMLEFSSQYEYPEHLRLNSRNRFLKSSILDGRDTYTQLEDKIDGCLCTQIWV